MVAGRCGRDPLSRSVEREGGLDRLTQVIEVVRALEPESARRRQPRARSSKPYRAAVSQALKPPHLTTIIGLESDPSARQKHLQLAPVFENFEALGGAEVRQIRLFLTERRSLYHVESERALTHFRSLEEVFPVIEVENRVDQTKRLGRPQVVRSQAIARLRGAEAVAKPGEDRPNRQQQDDGGRSDRAR